MSNILFQNSVHWKTEIFNTIWTIFMFVMLLIHLILVNTNLISIIKSHRYMSLIMIANNLVFVSLIHFLPIQILLFSINFFISYKCNKCNYKGFSEYKNKGITAVAERFQQKQYDSWLLKSDKEKERIINDIEKEQNKCISGWLLFFLHFLAFLTCCAIYVFY